MVDLIKPWIYDNKWYVWSNTVFDSMDIMGCYNTLNGICTSGKTIEECISTCLGDCAAGYHVSFSDGSSMCASMLTVPPLYTSPVHQLRDQKIYPELNDVVVTSFVNTEVFPFPPDKGNAVFYEDRMSIKLSDANMYISKLNQTEDIKGEEDKVIVESDSGTIIQFSPIYKVINKVSRHNPVKYGETIAIIITGTDLSVQSNKMGNGFVWYPLGINIPGFIILSAEGKKGIVAYGDKILLNYEGISPIVVHKQSSVVRALDMPIEQLYNKDEYYTTFTLESHMTGYYCNGQTCESIPIRQTVADGLTSRYNGIIVGRDIGCWGMCKYLKSGTNEFEDIKNESSRRKDGLGFLVGIAIIVILSILVMYLLYR